MDWSLAAFLGLNTLGNVLGSSANNKIERDWYNEMKKQNLWKRQKRDSFDAWLQPMGSNASRIINNYLSKEELVNPVSSLGKFQNIPSTLPKNFGNWR